MHKSPLKGDFPGGPLGKNPPRNAGDVGFIPGRGTSIPHVMELLSLWATTRESTKKDPVCCNKDWMQSNIFKDPLKP